MLYRIPWGWYILKLSLKTNILLIIFWSHKDGKQIILSIIYPFIHQSWSTTWLGNNSETWNNFFIYYLSIHLSHGYSYLPNSKGNHLHDSWLIFSLVFDPFLCFGVLFCFVFHVPWLRMPFSVLKIITTENKFGYMWFSQLIPFILYISMCPDKQVQKEFLSALKCDIRGIHVHLQWRIRRNHKSPGLLLLWFSLQNQFWKL